MHQLFNQSEIERLCSQKKTNDLFDEELLTVMDNQQDIEQQHDRAKCVSNLQSGITGPDNDAMREVDARKDTCQMAHSADDNLELFPNIKDLQNQRDQDYGSASHGLKKVPNADDRTTTTDLNPNQDSFSLEKLQDLNKIEKKSEAKNIAKNYGSRIIDFIKREQDLVLEVFRSTGREQELQLFKAYLKSRTKRQFTASISRLSNFWFSSPYARELRMLSGRFLRKHTHRWIFNSADLKDKRSTLKYLPRMKSGVSNPEHFGTLA